MRSTPIALLLAALPACGLWAAEPAEAPPGAKKPKFQSLALTLMAEEEQWEFRPPAGRIDPFFDREAVLKIDRAIRQAQREDVTIGRSTKQTTARSEANEALAWANQEIGRIQGLMSQRQYEDGLRSSESAIKRLERFAQEPGMDKALPRLAAFREQALEALIRNEAQAAFDSLDLRVDGILWAENGTRLAIINGEPRAVGINDRVKDCTVITIDTDRVDFRFHFSSPRSEQGRRFEFPRYVGEDARSASKR